MVSLGHMALDGTKVKVNASKQKALSHERMLRAEILDVLAPGDGGGREPLASGDDHGETLPPGKVGAQPHSCTSTSRWRGPSSSTNSTAW